MTVIYSLMLAKLKSEVSYVDAVDVRSDEEILESVIRSRTTLDKSWLGGESVCCKIRTMDSVNLFIVERKVLLFDSLCED